jgi:dolichol-phosphate mannosyltransferase
VLETIDYAGVASQGYCFQVDLALRAYDAGFRVLEVPITFVERERGESKMSGAIVREAFLRVGQWGVGRRLEQVRRAVSGRD